MAQQAMPNSIGHRLDARAQLATASTLVMTMFLPNFPSIRLMALVYQGAQGTSNLAPCGGNNQDVFSTPQTFTNRSSPAAATSYFRTEEPATDRQPPVVTSNFH